MGILVLNMQLIVWSCWWLKCVSEMLPSEGKGKLWKLRLLTSQHGIHASYIINLCRDSAC